MMIDVTHLIQDMVKAGILELHTDKNGEELGYAVTQKGRNVWQLLDAMRQGELAELLSNAITGKMN